VIGKKEGLSEGVDTRGKEETQRGEVRHKVERGDTKGRGETQGGEGRDKGEEGLRHKGKGTTS